MFEVHPNDGFELVLPLDQKDWEVFAAFDGSPRASAWRPIRVERAQPNERKKVRLADFPWLAANALALKQNSARALRALLEANGELLPLSTDDGVELFVFNARAVDALDQARSKIWRFPGSDRIGRIEKAVFQSSRVRDADVLVLPHRGTLTYASDRFVAAVEQARLTGLKFKAIEVAD